MATATLDREQQALLAAQVDDALRLTLAYTIEVDRLAAAVGGVLRQNFIDLTHTDRADIAGFIAESEPTVIAGIEEGADLAAAYISEMAGVAVTAERVAAPVIPWDDPFLRTWHNLSEGEVYEAAKAKGATVAEMMGYDAVTDGTDGFMGRNAVGVRAWRRVISAKACEWCRVVSTQLYKTQATATFGHHGCKCAVLPVFHEQADHAKAINTARLKELKAEGTVTKVSEARERARDRARAARAQM